MKVKRRGNCYVTSEAIYHLTGGKAGVWAPERVRWEGDTHWYLRHRSTGEVLDVTRKQFKRTPPYHKGVRAGFLTGKPSKRAKALMGTLVWQMCRVRGQ